MHLPRYTIRVPNDIQKMNTDVGPYRERLDLTTMIKIGFKVDATSSIPVRYANLCETFLKHINLPKITLTHPS